MSRFVFLQALLGWSVSSGAFIVTQSPDVSVMEGETINIACCWTEHFDRLSVSWTKNQKTVKTKQLVYRNSSERKYCSDLTFKSIKSEDSGNYTCKLSVDIPRLYVTEGSGTLITVTVKIQSSEKENSHLITVGDSHQEELHYNLLRCLPILALFISFCFLYRLKTKAQPSAPAAPGNIPCSDLRAEEENQEEDESGQRRTDAE